jgi:NADH-quinone oxidoreductase subunit M
MHLGLDGISVSLIVLTALLTVSAVLISFESIKHRESEFYAALLALEAGLIGVFCAFDLILFYAFFELTLIPLFLIIAIWGGAQRQQAATKFFLYTLAGSVITLIGVVALVVLAVRAGLPHPCSIPDISAWLQRQPLDPQTQVMLFCLLSAGFLVKVPVVPFHTWLPLAHVEAPTAGSVLLAGVLLKLGTYGFLRIAIPFFPYACTAYGVPIIGALSVVGIIYGSFCALAQQDIKKLVAYSSVAHLGYCMLGLFALNVEGMTGGVLQMINHGLSTGALFLIVGMIYDRYHTRQLTELGGLAQRLPLIAVGLVFISMASIGLPGLNGFVGEFLSLAGMFQRDWVYAALGATGVILAAWYMLTMIQHGLFGPLKEPDTHGEMIRDMGLREIFALAPLAFLCLWLGVLPEKAISLIRPDIAAIARIYETAPVNSLAKSVPTTASDRELAGAIVPLGEPRAEVYESFR